MDSLIPSKEDLIAYVQMMIDEGIIKLPSSSGTGETHPGWWSDYHLELDVFDPLDITLQSLNYPTNLANMKLKPEERKGLVIDEVTMSDLKLLDLIETLDSTKTRSGRRMLEYLVHFPLRDLGEIAKRQKAIGELSDNPHLIASLNKYFDIMAKNERGFVEYTFPQKDDPPPYHETFQAARAYLAAIPPILKVLKNTKSGRLEEIANNLECLLNKGSVKKLYESVVKGDDADIMDLHPDTWTGSISHHVIHTLQSVSPIMGALKDTHIKADLGKGSFRLTPRQDGEEINIHYPLDLSLDLQAVRECYFEQNGIFNLYYTAGLVEALCSLAGLEARIHPVNTLFPTLKDADRYDCHFVDPADPYLLIKQGTFTSNAYVFDAKKRGYIITGPNTGGKTVYGFTLPKLQVLSQAGAPIPATEAEAIVADSIFTLRPASKEQVGEGRYLHSLVRGRYILEKATPRSIVGVDDFEGTDPEDCYEESLIIAKKLLRIGAATTITTQDRRVALDIERNESGDYTGIVPVQMKCEIIDEGVKFYYEVIPGVGKSIGRACAKGAQMDDKSLDDLMVRRGF